MAKKRGFTLIELLVVIAIIALLMAILMPSLKRLRQEESDMNKLGLNVFRGLWLPEGGIAHSKKVGSTYYARDESVARFTSDAQFWGGQHKPSIACQPREHLRRCNICDLGIISSDIYHREALRKPISAMQYDRIVDETEASPDTHTMLRLDPPRLVVRCPMNIAEALPLVPFDEFLALCLVVVVAAWNVVSEVRTRLRHDPEHLKSIERKATKLEEDVEEVRRIRRKKGLDEAHKEAKKRHIYDRAAEIESETDCLMNRICKANDFSFTEGKN